MTTLRKYQIAIFGISTLSLIFSAVIMAIAWEHNPQCEFHCDSVVYWAHWFRLGSFTFLMSAMILCAAYALCCLTIRTFNRTGYD